MLEAPVDNLTSLSWPPPYRVRFSAKARNIFLRVTPERGLEIVIPEKRKRFNIPLILEEKKTWVLKILKKYTFQSPSEPRLEVTQTTDTNGQGLISDEAEPKINLFGFVGALELPQSLQCQALEEIWKIDYEPNPNAKKIKLICLPFEQTLLLKGNFEDKKAIAQLLIRWLMQKAKLHFFPWLNQLAISSGLHFSRLLIRGQSTLWGSCNAKKSISLNYKLLFLPKSLAEHVFIHELCHTVHLNHSSAFWQTVARFDENWKNHRTALKTAERYLPNWIGLI